MHVRGTVLVGVDHSQASTAQQRCPSSGQPPGPLDFSAPGVGAGRVGRCRLRGNHFAKNTHFLDPTLPIPPHRRDDAQGPNRPRALNQTSPPSRGAKAGEHRGPADLSLPLPRRDELSCNCLGAPSSSSAAQYTRAQALVDLVRLNGHGWGSELIPRSVLNIGGIHLPTLQYRPLLAYLK